LKIDFTTLMLCLRQVGDLKVNRKLSKIAERWAKKLAKMNTLQHSQGQKYKDKPIGENLAYKFSSNKEGYKGAPFHAISFAAEM